MSPAGSPQRGGPTELELSAWLAERIADAAGLSPDEVDEQTPFADYGLDSVAAVGLAGELEEWLGRELDDTLLWEYPNIRMLARHLSDVTPSSER